MKTTVEKPKPAHAKIILEITPEDLKPTIDGAYADISTQISVPGFRKGKVPSRIIDQRVGRGAVLEHAVNKGLDNFYRDAMVSNDLRPLGSPKANIDTWPAEKDFSGDLVVTIEVDVFPELVIPEFESITLTVDTAVIDPSDVEAELDRLRSRFGTLASVDRPAHKGDFVQISLVAHIDDNEVDSASNVSYEIGSGELLEGIDEALETLTAGEIAHFESTLVGGDHEGEKAQITLTLEEVKERQLPEADDDFAQLASEFDTIGQLRSNLRENIKHRKAMEQANAARQALVDHLLKTIEIPFPEHLVEEAVEEYLKSNDLTEDEAAKAEHTEAQTKVLKTQIVCEALIHMQKISVTEHDLNTYVYQAASQYGMDPNEFARIVSENNQVNSIASEIANSKALSKALAYISVVDTAGETLDLSQFFPREDEQSETSEDESAPTA